MKLNLRQRLLVTTLLVGASVVASPAVAQDAPAPLPTPSPTDDTATPETTTPVEGTTTTPSTSAEGENVETSQDVVVTGSRIPQPNLTSVSPVTVLNSQEVALQGTTRTEDLINTLPQAFAGQGGNIANGATGTATVNLRGLGAERTLVLINGRRLLPGDPSSSAADINTVPAGLIKRVDVLTGGASSVYGSDAVSGVVNFIMDTNFQGFQIDAQYSLFQHNNGTDDRVIAGLNRRGFPYPSGNVADGGTINLDLTFGTRFADNRGHLVAYAGYRKLRAVTQGNRDYSSCVIAPVAADPDTINCGGSGTSAAGTFFTNFDANPDLAGFQGFTVAGSAFAPSTAANVFNFGPTNYFQRPDERYTFGAFAEYEISNAVKPYLEAMFMDDRTVAQIAASGNFGNTLTINCDNPLLSAQQLAIACAPDNLVGFAPPVADDPDTPEDETFAGTPASVFVDPTTGLTFNQGNLQILRRNVEGGPRQDDLQHTSYRIVGGVRGDINPAFSYDAYYLFGRVNFAETYSNDFSVNRLTRALDVVAGPDGQPICRTVQSGVDPNCVPYDIFTTGGVTPAALSYLQTPGLQRGQNEQRVANASITGLLGEYGLRTPWSDEGLGFNLGAEYRKDSVNLITDIAFQTGDLAGQGAPTLPISGAIEVRELFGEARLPLVSQNFIHSLSLEAGYRYSKYKVADNSFSTNAYKFAVDFAPIRDIRLRGSYNRAIRAPNVQELFATQRVALNGSSDPCTGAEPEATLAQCQLTGVTAAQYGNLQENPAGQYNGLIGGNPDLTPEKATTKSIGVVIQPSFLRGFAATVDYFDIEIENAIQQIGQDTIIQTCIQTGDENFCGLINRDQFGSIYRTSGGFVIDTDQNIGSFSTRGIDVSASYTRAIGRYGSVSASIVGTYLDELITNNGVSDAYDCAGLYGAGFCGTPNPEWRHKARLTFTSPNGIGLSLQWRYFGSVKNERLSDQEQLQGAIAAFNERIKAQSYFDLTSTFRVGDSFGFRLGVQNLFDKDPPLVGSSGGGAVNQCPAVTCSGNTFPQVYDALGRYLFAGVTLDF